MAVLSFTNRVAEEIRERCGRSKAPIRPDFPNYVGTIDSFIGRFLAVPFNPWNALRQPTMLDSWDRIPSEIWSTSGIRVSLDWLKDDDGAPPQFNDRAISRELRSVPAEELKNLASRAARLRKSLRHNGYMSSHDARIAATQMISEERRGPHLGRALAARFKEVLVDEAQDCNSLDWTILEWLSSVGIPICFVADANQSIYEFRDAVPGRLADLACSAKQLTLTANFRSTAKICQVAATLRSKKEPDLASGIYAAESQRLVVIHGPKLDGAMGERFTAHAASLGISSDECIVLGHADAAACRVAGRTAEDEVKDSKVKQLAESVLQFKRRGASGRDRVIAVTGMQRLLMSLLDKESPLWVPEDLAIAEGIPPRWLRRAAVHLLATMPFPPSEKAEVPGWLDQFHKFVDALAGPNGRSPAFNFSKSPRPPKGRWEIQTEGGQKLAALTVHKAKGAEFKAVLFVIPQFDVHSLELLTAWAENRESEARRVAYVAVTRARRLLGLAVAEKQRPTVLAILKAAGVEFDLLGDPIPPTVNQGEFW